MKVIVREQVSKSDKAASEIYCNTLIEMAEKNEKICVLGADLQRSCGPAPFQKKFPERYFDVGIAEANMTGIASGLSNRGFIPFTNSFVPFAVRRCLDQIYLSGSYQKMNIKIVGASPGVLAMVTGGTHMAFDDVADCIAIPEMTVVEPSDEVQLKQLLPQIAEMYGMVYLRFDRANKYCFYEEGSEFEIGKSAVLREGADVTLIATGSICLNEALKAADILKEKGISARVIDMYTIKPLDEEAVICAAKETGAIVTVENANVISSMGSLVAQVLAKKCYAPLETVGAQDRFGEVGVVDYLIKAMHMAADDIVRAAEKAISRK